MTRIVVVGESAEAGLRGSLISGFQRSGCIVDVLDLAPGNSAWFASAAYRMPMLGAKFRRDVRQQTDMLAQNGGADLVVVVKGALLDSRSIDYMRTRFDSPVVCWNPDSPFDHALSNRGAGIPQTVSAYDAYVTWAEDVAARLSAAATRVLVIPFAWDLEIMRPTAGSGEAAGRFVFIGTGTPERSAMLASLAHLQPIVFGYRWPEIEGVNIRPPVMGLDFCRIVGEAKWNLNLLRPQNERSHNMRTFELVGAGGNQVAPLTGDHRRFLGDDGRTVLFQTKQELESIVRSDPSERPSRDSSLLEGHTYGDRVRQLLTDLGIS